MTHIWGDFDLWVIFSSATGRLLKLACNTRIYCLDCFTNDMYKIKKFKSAHIEGVLSTYPLEHVIDWQLNLTQSIYH